MLGQPSSLDSPSLLPLLARENRKQGRLLEGFCQEYGPIFPKKPNSSLKKRQTNSYEKFIKLSDPRLGEILQKIENTRPRKISKEIPPGTVPGIHQVLEKQEKIKTGDEKSFLIGCERGDKGRVLYLIWNGKINLFQQLQPFKQAEYGPAADQSKAEPRKDVKSPSEVVMATLE